MMRRRRRRACKRVHLWKALLCAVCVTAVLCGSTLLGALTYFKAQATPRSAPDLSVSDLPASYDEQGFPLVDWEYWRSVNPDIVGWVTVPGTSVDFPIVQAHKNSATFYLTHDIYRNWNYLGCPYLDAGCEQNGLDARCAMVYGHNSDDGSMFADFATYSDKDFAAEHAQILLQTPTEKRVLEVAAINIVKGTDTNSKPSFDEPVVAFCTCSYNYWADERTIVYAIDAVRCNAAPQDPRDQGEQP